jgi:hypothetical protein
MGCSPLVGQKLWRVFVTCRGVWVASVDPVGHLSRPVHSTPSGLTSSQHQQVEQSPSVLSQRGRQSPSGERALVLGTHHIPRSVGCSYGVSIIVPRKAELVQGASSHMHEETGAEAHQEMTV